MNQITLSSWLLIDVLLTFVLCCVLYNNFDNSKFRFVKTKNTFQYSKRLRLLFFLILQSQEKIISFFVATLFTHFHSKKKNKQRKIRLSKIICQATTSDSNDSEDEFPNNLEDDLSNNSELPLSEQAKDPLHKNIESSLNTDFNSQKLDVTNLCYPGIYEILDIKNDKSYYGESNLLFRRFAQHYQGLVNESHECEALMVAFKEQNKQIDNFRFIVHKSGPEWENQNLRLEYEQKLISANQHRCYNIQGTDQISLKSENVRLPLMYKGTSYKSIREAYRGEKIGRSTILRHLRNPQYIDLYYLKVESFGEIPVFGKQKNGWSVLFNSIKECVAANYATNTQNARRKIQRKEPGWRYAHVGPAGKPLRIPYTLQAGELNYEQYCEILSFVYLVNFILKSSK